MSILSFLGSPAKHQTGVYKIVNRKTGWIYIGATTQPMTDRWDQHRRRLENKTHHNSRLQFDWGVYGLRGFRFAVVEVVDPDLAFEREKKWQRVYYAKGKCYNPDPDAPPPFMKPSNVSREEKLYIYTILRVAGITRDAARPTLKNIGVPLDNNLWTEAGR